MTDWIPPLLQLIQRSVQTCSLCWVFHHQIYSLCRCCCRGCAHYTAHVAIPV